MLGFIDLVFKFNNNDVNAGTNIIVFFCISSIAKINLQLKIHTRINTCFLIFKNVLAIQKSVTLRNEQRR